MRGRLGLLRFMFICLDRSAAVLLGCLYLPQRRKAQGSCGLLEFFYVSDFGLGMFSSFADFVDCSFGNVSVSRYLGINVRMWTTPYCMVASFPNKVALVLC